MYIQERQDGTRTVFEYTPLLIPALLAATSAYLMWVTVSAAFGLAETDQPAWIAALGAIVLLAIAAWFCRREQMIFNTDTQTVRWTKWSLREQTGGDIPFDDIRHLTIEAIGSDGVMSYRLVVETEGARIPMTSHFAGNPDHWEPVAERLRRLIGLKVDDETNACARSLAAAGKKDEAIRVLTDTKAMSIAGATGLVEQLGEPGAA